MLSSLGLLIESRLSSQKNQRNSESGNNGKGITVWGVRALGLVVGGLLALGVAAMARPSPTLRVVSDVDGPVTDLVIHIGSDQAASALPTYRDFLSKISDDIQVVALCADASSMSVAASLGRIRPVRAILADHPLTSWSKDRWLALSGTRGTSLLAPRHEDGARIWPLRAGDAQAAKDLVEADSSLDLIDSAWDFDGGDVVADDRMAFVASAVMAKNMGRMGSTPQEIAKRFSARLGLRVLVFEGAPDHHAGMYCMVAGDGRLLVGDPSLAQQLRPHGTELTRMGDDYSEEIQAKFDAVAQQAQAAGYHITRIPVVPESDGRGWLSWCNAVLDERDGQRIVYLPHFADAPVLQAHAEATWRNLGFTVIPIQCDGVRHLGGTLRCLVSTLGRGLPPGSD